MVIRPTQINKINNGVPDKYLASERLVEAARLETSRLVYCYQISIQRSVHHERG